MKYLIVGTISLLVFTVIADARIPVDTKQFRLLNDALAPRAVSTPGIEIETFPPPPPPRPSAGEQPPSDPSTSGSPTATAVKQEPATQGRNGNEPGKDSSPADKQGKTQQSQENVDSREDTSKFPRVATNPELDLLNKKTDEEYHSALRAYYGKYAAGLSDKLENRRKVMNWQFTSSIIIFVLVILLVITGVIFSGVQFYLSLQPLRKRRETRTQVLNEDLSTSHLDLGKETVTEISMSADGFKISSRVLGVIILFISFLFFYLYLWVVYPIRELK